ncbi:cytochrome P450 2J5-like [Rhinatrema bivittatum]|uniref:cytochrome P450 2J5-like n=1 Tax=Rhinatrema bivittatum TaxID=194408 RepID=UPI001126EA79|nr:cytochrome P450 2J5-like [Rhinatrema bivittatum]
MLMLAEVLLAFLLSLLILRFLKLRWAGRRLPPGPTPLPIIGNLWTLSFRLHHETLIQLAKIYGNIFTVWAGETPLIVFSGCKAVKDALISHGQEFSGRPITPFVNQFTQGKGIVASNGHGWRQQRCFGQMFLRRLGLQQEMGLEWQIQEEARHLLESFTSRRGRSLDPSVPIRHAVSNVTGALVFGRRFSSEDRNFQHLLKAINFVVSFNGTHWGRLFDTFPRLMRRVPGPHQEVFVYVEYVRSYVKQEIRSHLENPSDEPKDLTDFYLAQISKTKDDPNSTYDESNMIQLVIDFLLASSDTISTTLHWAVLYMVVYPAVQEEVQKELDAVLIPSQIVCYEDRKRLPYTNAVIHEIQRYANIASVGLARQCTKDTSIRGFLITKGTIIIPNLSSVLFDPEHWETPQQFNPSHFLDEGGNFVTNNAFLPFSAGHRVCLGEQMARIEIFILFASLLRAFTFQLPEGVTEINKDYIYGTVIQPHPYEICAIPRWTILHRRP